jgi:hypothetical protein
MSIAAAIRYIAKAVLTASSGIHDDARRIDNTTNQVRLARIAANTISAPRALRKSWS